MATYNHSRFHPIAHLAHDDARSRRLKIEPVNPEQGLQAVFVLGGGAIDKLRRLFPLKRRLQATLPWLFFPRWTLNDVAIRLQVLGWQLRCCVPSVCFCF